VSQTRWCVGVSAYAATGVANATVSINGGAATPVPEGGSVNLHPPLGSSKAPTITFVNTTGYGIETVE
jgi:hypothetical protein